ncbi:hypothetical protein JCM10207_006553 [Rhodosporidiobolus poonsookiae]
MLTGLFDGQMEVNDRSSSSSHHQNNNASSSSRSSRRHGTQRALGVEPRMSHRQEQLYNKTQAQLRREWGWQE